MDPTENTGNPTPVFVQIGASSTPDPDLFKDPVCQMTVTPEDAIDQLVYKGSTYYFCGVNCAVKFSRKPEQYAVPPIPKVEDSEPVAEESTTQRSEGASAAADEESSGAKDKHGNHEHSSEDAKTVELVVPTPSAEKKGDDSQPDIKEPDVEKKPPIKEPPEDDKPAVKDPDEDGKAEDEKVKTDQSAAKEQLIVQDLVVDAPDAEITDGPQYTCPMHPQVLRDKAGSCPVCGMALEPFIPVAGLTNDGELRDMERRFRWALPLTMAVFICGLPEMVNMTAEQFVSAFTPPVINFTQLVLTSPVIWLAAPFFGRAVDSIKHQSWNMYTLIGTGVGVTYAYSLLASLAPAVIPAGFGMHDGMPYTYFEPAAVVTTLALLGQVMELRARKQTGLAITELLNLSPVVAHFVKLDGSELDIEVSQLAVKDRLRVRPGENIPTDGIVLEGRSSVDESMITGESNAIDKSSGDTVIGGTTNQNGSLTIEATKVGKDTLVARIVKLVAAAQRSRAPVQHQVDKIAAKFVPAVGLIAILTFMAWATWGPPPALSYAFLNAIAVLIVACPCALGLATPMSVMVAVGRGARAGVLIRDAQALEKLSEVTLLVVDKTGTLTEGKPSVTKIITQGKWAEGQIMMLSAAVEAGSEHPLARAFVEHADSRDLADCKATNFVYQPGGGVTADADSHSLAIGTAKFLRETFATDKIDLEKALARLAPQIEALTAEGATPVMVACDGELAALVAFSDKVRPSAKATIDELKSLGIKIQMLTGDQEATARYVASQLGITDFTAEVSPAQKYDYIVKLQESADGNIVAMAGDGVNDAPALAKAAVGIAMGSGTNIAIESADIVLAHGDLSGILRAVRLSHAMKANIKQNLNFAFGYNILAVPIAAGLLYPFTHTLLNPMLASVAMAFSSVSVIANALRLRRAAL